MLHIEDTDYNPKLLPQSGDEVKSSKLEVLKIQKVIQSRLWRDRLPNIWYRLFHFQDQLLWDELL